MQKISYFQALYLAFYSRPFYRDMAKSASGAGLLYLLFLTALAWAPEMMNLHAEFTEYIEREAPRYVEQVPTITITKGEASTAAEVPHTIYEADGKTPVAIIDTSGKTRSLAGTGAVLLITRTQIIVQREGAGPRIFDLADFRDLVVDKKTVYEWLAIANNLFAIVMYPFVVFFGFLVGLLQLVICALVGSSMAVRFGIAMSMKDRMRLASAAITPAMVLQTAHAVLDIPFPYRLPISLIITIGYLFFAFSAVAEETGAA